MAWVEVVPQILVALAILFLPGTACALLLGVRGALAAGAAPAASLAVVAGSAVVAERLGVPFGYGPVAAGTGVALAVAGGIGLLVRRIAPPAPRPARTGPADGHASAASARTGLGRLAFGGALVIAVGLLTWRVTEALIGPRNFSQRFDIVFHLNGVRRTLDTGDGSSLTMGVLMGHADGVLAFYPAGWHDLVALVAQTLPAGPWQIPLAISAANVALAAVVWSVGVLALTRAIAGPRPRVLLFAGVFAAAFTVFPLRLLEWGTVLPYFCGVALAPGVLALVLSALRLARADRSSWLGALLVGVLAAAGLAFCHPSVAVAVIGLSVPAVGAAIVRWARIRRAAGRGPLLPVLAAAGTAIAVVGMWIVTRPRNGFPGWETPHTLGKAVLGFLASAPVGGPVAVAAAGCIAVAVVVIAVRRRDLLWLALSYAAAGFLYVVVTGFPRSAFRTAVTGPWYEDWFRIAGLLAIPAVPLAALGAAAIVSAATAAIGRLRGAPVPALAPAVTVLAVVALIPLTQVRVIDHEVGMTRNAYVLTEDADLVGPGEIAFMQRVAGVVPDGQIVANNPYDGSAELYAFAGVPVLIPHLNYTYAEDDLLLMADLVHAPSRPDVCAALERTGVRWVIQLGRVVGGFPEAERYPGIGTVTGGPGFEEVLADGERRLFRITACGLG
ncbi:hypothetical protein G3H63_04575 [Microbacterium resistens]|uniref:DUF6541 family protein n=1 Tax=Microbacterium resistens TaxID=156977 RepID=UPI001C5A351D|nr:DUF6541 family protein [Microbacterium resistens]MBW1638356.1 hypothetical protein [Microbacterium resistens]